MEIKAALALNYWLLYRTGACPGDFILPGEVGSLLSAEQMLGDRTPSC